MLEDGELLRCSQPPIGVEEVIGKFFEARQVAFKNYTKTLDCHGHEHFQLLVYEVSGLVVVLLQ